jgi:hypothetical protein
LLRLHYFLAFKRFWLITILQKQTSLIWQGIWIPIYSHLV